MQCTLKPSESNIIKQRIESISQYPLQARQQKVILTIFKGQRLGIIRKSGLHETIATILSFQVFCWVFVGFLVWLGFFGYLVGWVFLTDQMPKGQTHINFPDISLLNF